MEVPKVAKVVSRADETTEAKQTTDQTSKKENESPTSPVTGSRAVKLRDFSGRDEYWETYSVHFRLVQKLNKWSPELALWHLGVHLTGDALDFFSDLPEEHIEDYEYVTQALKERFAKMGSAEEARRKLDLLRQKPDQSLQDLAQNVRALAHAGYSTIPLEAREEHAVRHFLRAIADKNLSIAVATKEPATMTEATKAAAKYFELTHVCEVTSKAKSVRQMALELEKEAEHEFGSDSPEVEHARAIYSGGNNSAFSRGGASNNAPRSFSQGQNQGQSQGQRQSQGQNQGQNQGSNQVQNQGQNQGQGRWNNNQQGRQNNYKQNGYGGQGKQPYNSCHICKNRGLFAPDCPEHPDRWTAVQRQLMDALKSGNLKSEITTQTPDGQQSSVYIASSTEPLVTASQNTATAQGVNGGGGGSGGRGRGRGRGHGRGRGGGQNGNGNSQQVGQNQSQNASQGQNTNQGQPDGGQNQQQTGQDAAAANQTNQQTAAATAGSNTPSGNA